MVKQLWVSVLVSVDWYWAENPYLKVWDLLEKQQMHVTQWQPLQTLRPRRVVEKFLQQL
jgi:hypothetical protein